MPQSSEVSQGILWEQVVLKLLDWPFLLFILIVVLLYFTRHELKGLVSRSNVKITWGDRAIELSELADNVDQDLDPLKERVEQLEQKLQQLTQSSSSSAAVDSEQESVNIRSEPPAPASPNPSDIENVLNIALSNPHYKYRTAEGVARELELPVQYAQQILAEAPNVRVTKSRDGRELYTKQKSSNN